MSCNQPSRVHQALRRATAAAHHALDHHPLMQRLTVSDLTREQYAESLAAMYPAHVRIERLVHESRHHLESGLKLSARQTLLEADLIELGRPVPPVSHLPLDPLEGRAAWWGWVYVLEGSRRGGAVIARRIHSNLGDTVPCRFFADAMAPDDHHALLARLERELEDHDDLERAVASAQAAFALYKAELDAFDGGKRDGKMWLGEAKATDERELEAALEACALQPVHIPGAIQPHGALIAMDDQLQQVRQVSANLEAILGVSVQEALAMTPERLFTRRWLDQIRAQLDSPYRYGALIISLRIRGQTRRFRLLPFRSGSRLVVELEPISSHPERWLFGALADWQTALSGHRTRDGLLRALVTLVRELTGYDRVMIYRFDEDWNGCVVAESLAEGVDSYLGHHFPASDLPAQVRRLYSIESVRDIPDATVEAVPLVPAIDPVDDAPLDLSLGILRAVAPIHVRYLANMGVVASMSIALHLDRRLWGLLACHAASPNILSPALRDALRAKVQTACFQLDLIQAREEAALIHQANDSREMLVDQRGEFPDPAEIVARHGPAWLEVFQAAGAALLDGERVASVGNVPDAGSIHAIVDWLGDHHSAGLAWSSHELGRTGLSAFCEPARAAGMLAVPLPIRAPRQAWLLFFRPEKAETRLWAGNPEKAVDRESGRLSPRQSFESWKETVRGKSARWALVELRAAADLASDLAVLIAADEIRRLNQRLEHLASSDHLTGLWNRYRMEEAIDHEVSVTERYSRSCALIMLDIDHFKRFNDTWGHDAGDAVLVKVAQTILIHLRDTDYVCRWGGEEFIVLAAGTAVEGASNLAERLREAIDALAIPGYGNVTASFGVAVHRKGELSRDLVKRADLAMYAAKESGRNRVEISAG